MKTMRISGKINGININEFIKEHYVLEEVEVYVLKEEKIFDEVIKLVLLSNSLENHINYDTMHRIFDGCDFSFHEGFYEFLMDNFELILSNKRVQTKIGEIGKCFDSIKDYYHFTAGIKTPSNFIFVLYGLFILLIVPTSSAGFRK